MKLLHRGSRWHSPSYFERVAREVETLGVKGFVTHCNSWFEPASLNTPAKRLNFELFVNALNGADAGKLRQHSIKVLAESFGDDSKQILEALEKLSYGVLHFSRVSHRIGEGFTFGWNLSILPMNREPGNLMLANGTPPEWCREGLITVKEYIDYLSIHEYQPGCLDILRGSRTCPAHLMRQAALTALEAEQELVALGKKWNNNKECQDLVICAGLVAAQANYLAATIEALLAYYSAKACTDLMLQKEKAKECIDKFCEARVGMARLREKAIQLSLEHFGSAHPQNQLLTDLAKAYEVFSIESALYERECQEFLDGQVWTMSNIEISWKGIQTIGPLTASWSLIEKLNLKRLGMDDPKLSRYS